MIYLYKKYDRDKYSIHIIDMSNFRYKCYWSDLKSFSMWYSVTKSAMNVKIKLLKSYDYKLIDEANAIKLIFIIYIIKKY